MIQSIINKQIQSESSGFFMRLKKKSFMRKISEYEKNFSECIDDFTEFEISVYYKLMEYLKIAITLPFFTNGLKYFHVCFCVDDEEDYNFIRLVYNNNYKKYICFTTYELDKVRVDFWGNTKTDTGISTTTSIFSTKEEMRKKFKKMSGYHRIRK